MTKQKWIIKDWADNVKFEGKKFDTFQDADEYLTIYFNDNDMDYEEWRGEYYIEPILRGKIS